MTAQEIVYVALQQWRDSADVQQAMIEKPADYDGVIALQSIAIAHATPRDWKCWAETATRQGPRLLAVELAQRGHNQRHRLATNEEGTHG